MNVAWACVGEEAGERNRVFCRRRRWKVPPVCSGCGLDRFEVNRFLLCVMQRVVFPVCVVLFVSWIRGCRSHWNGCMIVVIWCCHVRRYMRVSHVMLQNALWWLHECCMLHGACVAEEAGARNLAFFRVKWLQLAMKGTSCVGRLRLRSFRA